MTKDSDEDINSLFAEILKSPKIPADIVNEKASTREHVIVLLANLFAVCFKRANKQRLSGGEKVRQRWFSISASLAHSLARLVTDLEYERLRLDLNALKKKVFEEHVPSPRIPVHGSQHGRDPTESGKQET